MVTESNYKADYLTKDSLAFQEYLNEKKGELISGELTGIFYIPDKALQNKGIQFYSKTPKNINLTRKVEYPVNKILIQKYFSNKNLSNVDLDYARRGVNIKEFKVSEGNEIEEEGYGNLILAYIFSFLLYISLLMMGSMTMQSVIGEKSNRIIEVLLSSVSSKELMTGKIIGSSITGVFQMAVWLLPVLLVTSTAWFVLPKEFMFNLSGFQFGYLLLNFFIGLVTFLGLFATVGSIFENAQEAQSGMWPVMMLIIIPFFIALSMMENPNNKLAEIASMSPFSSIIVMPARMTLTEVPLWQFILSIVISIITILAIFPLAGKIYRVGILSTGKKPKWSEVIKWLKYKY
jgi:ABC-2 type transport system permease protein